MRLIIVLMRFFKLGLIVMFFDYSLLTFFLLVLNVMLIKNIIVSIMGFFYDKEYLAFNKLHGKNGHY